MKYISVQPDITYFHWQVEVYVNNFINIGINPKNINVIFMTNSIPSLRAIELQKKYNEVNFYFYNDDRPDKRYIPSIKPWGMFKHFNENPYLETEKIFYHDSDIVFREKIDETFFTDNKWYLSDTISYIGYNYCVSKGFEQLKKMADIVGVSIDTIKENQTSSGGAQYIMNNVQTNYWEKVYNDSNSLYWLMDSESKLFNIKNDYPIQKWCAEMWATLWNIWYFNCETEVHKELNFSFATSPISEWYDRKIMHNAGVTDDCKKSLFYKADFINQEPYGTNFDYVDKNKCSFKYVENINKVKK